MWYKQKTTWTAISGVVVAIGAYVAGEIQLATLMEAGFGAVSLIFLRQGVAKSGPKE